MVMDLQNFWFKSNHPQTNPKGYSSLPDVELVNFDLSKLNSRKKDLIELLGIIYNYQIFQPDYFKSDKEDFNAFYKYLKRDLIGSYPFKEFTTQAFDTLPDEDFSKWLKNVLDTTNNRVKWTSVLIDYSRSEEKETILKHKYHRFLLLAEICHHLDKIQVRDYQQAKIKIDLKGKLMGELDALVYGHKHSLSAYLGQHILRNFPFKDYLNFHSESWLINKKGVYEHYTPMSFFRDLIWVKYIDRLDQKLLFDYEDSNYRAYTIEEWLSILWNRYRTIFISRIEDKNLNKKQKSRREPDAYCKLGIKVNNLELWEELHKIEHLITLHHTHNETSRNWKQIINKQRISN